MVLGISSPDYQFCPFCGKKLSLKKEEGQERKYCPDCNWTYYPHVGSASAAIIIKNKKILLVKRNRPPYKNTWMLPAGFTDFGEHPKETAVREAKEETGVEIKPSKLFAVFQSVDDPRLPGHFCFFYETKITGGEVKIYDKEENSAIDWFYMDQLPLVGWQSHKKVLSLLQKTDKLSHF